MKLLSKLLLINWHYFSFQEMNFAQINFLTGKNASGKTTIIDALQLLILGDTSGRFFNKSATDKSDRSLRGYLRCECGDKENGETLYLRNGKFTSYIAGEFYDDVKKEAFTLGIVIDSYNDESYDYKFFHYGDTLPENRFVVDNIPLNQKDLRIFLSGKYKNTRFFETNSSYREYCKVLFGNLNNNFFTLFKRAIPFSPITNIEQFITEYVCDVKETIDIEQMQTNIRDYKRLEIEAGEVEKRLGYLTELNDKYREWKSDFDKVSLQRYLVNRGELYLANKFLDRLDDDVQDINNEIADKKRILTNCAAQIQKLKQERDNLVEEKFNNDAYKRRAVYEKNLRDVEEKIADLENQVAELRDAFFAYLRSWKNAVQNLLQKRKTLAPNIVATADSFLKSLLNLEETKAISAPILANFQKLVLEFLTNLSRESFALKNRKYQLEKETTTLEREIDVLKSGKKAYGAPLLKFKEIVENDLRAQYGRDIQVDFLADLVDIKDDSWRLAIETYLFSQRFYLIVDPQYVDDAIASYERHKKQYRFANFGILDTEKIARSDFPIKPRSIMEEMETKNPIVEKYLASLVGSLIKCENIAQLRKNPRSITRGGMLYQGYVARQLNFAGTIPFIGSRSAADQLDFKKEALRNARDELSALALVDKEIDAFQYLEIFNANEIKKAEVVLTSAQSLPLLRNKRGELNASVKSLSDDYLSAIEKNIADTEKDIVDLEGERNDLYGEIGKCKRDLQNIADEKTPQAKEAVERCKNVIKSQFARQWIIDTGEPAFMEASLTNKDLVVYLQNVRQSIATINSRVNSRWATLVEKRVKYNALYNLNDDANAKENDRYEKQYDDLKNTKLVEYREKITAAKENAVNQFKNDFLAKLKANFDTVLAQIDNLNDALASSRFGADQYRFTAAPRAEYKAYYEMINDPLLLSGQDINSDLFQSKYETVVEDLFRQITFVDLDLDKDVRSELEKNIAKFTDYRSYLKFDLIVTNKYGNRVSLSRNLLKRSGGETQIPFYIAILASFAQTYRVRLGDDKYNSIRLIVFDEAFSKMDSERIMESIKLLRQFGLQAILSAPPEKMADISGLVDETLCVVRDNTVSVVSEFKDLNPNRGDK